MWMNLCYPRLLIGPFSINILFCLDRHFIIISGGDPGQVDQHFLTCGFADTAWWVMIMTTPNRRLWLELQQYRNVFKPSTFILDE